MTEKEIEIKNESNKSDKDEELYQNDDIVQSNDKKTNEGEHNDEYSLEGITEHNDRQKKLFENTDERQHVKPKTDGITNTTDGADDPGFV